MYENMKNLEIHLLQYNILVLGLPQIISNKELQ